MLLANFLPVEEVLTTPKSTIPGLWRECTKLFERVYEADADDQRIQHGLDGTLVCSGDYQVSLRARWGFCRRSEKPFLSISAKIMYPLYRHCFSGPK